MYIYTYAWFMDLDLCCVNTGHPLTCRISLSYMSLHGCETLGHFSRPLVNLLWAMREDQSYDLQTLRPCLEPNLGAM